MRVAPIGEYPDTIFTAWARFDHDYYRDKHMPLIKSRTGAALKYYTVDKGLAHGRTWPPILERQT